MTDNEIIKALECCCEAELKEDCRKLKCPFFDNESQNCMNVDDEDAMNRFALSLINRQKAEIERLNESIQYGNEICENCQSDKDKGLKAARKRAIKDFAERIKRHCTSIELNEYIDSIVEEMVGE